MRVLMTKGLSGSGKSTIAKRMCEEHKNFRVVCKDDIRQQYFKDIPFSKELEIEVVKIRDAKIHDYLTQGLSVIVADTNLVEKHFTDVQAICDEFNITVETINLLNIPLEVCLDRNRQREEPLKDSVILNQYKNHVLRPLLAEKRLDTIDMFNRYDNKNKAVIVDIDGTIAMLSDRSPYSWDKVDSDIPNPIIRDMLNLMYDNGYTIIILSGRDGSCYDKTVEWLNTYNFKYDLFFMRDAGDNRPDEIIKEEIYNNLILGDYNVVAVFDDRTKVVNMWRNKLGLYTFDVNQTGLAF